MYDSFSNYPVDASSASTEAGSSGGVQIETVLEIVRTIGSEVVFKELLKAIMESAFRCGGANRGLLLRLRNAQLLVEAVAISLPDRLQVDMPQEAASSTTSPLSVFLQVLETKDVVNIEDCGALHPYSNDEYLRNSLVRSVTCLPLIRNCEVEGILYFEHTSRANVFTPARITLLKLLAAQAAHSLAHADLHAKKPEPNDWIRPALNTMPILAFTRDRSGVSDFHNQNWCDYTGLTAEEARGDGWRVVLHPQDAARNAEQRRADIEVGRAGKYEARLRGRDGQYRWFVTSSVPLRGDSGEIEKWYGACLDVDDLKHQEQRVNQSERFLLEAQRISHAGSWLWNVPSQRLSWSDEMFRILGLMPGSVSPSRELFYERVHPDDLQIVELGHRETLSGAHTEWVIDFRIVLPDGAVRHLHAILHPVTHETGAVFEILGTTMDVTEQRLRDQAIRESQEVLRLMVETIPGLWSATADGSVDSMNNQYLTYYPANRVSELATQSWLSHIHPDHSEMVTQRWNHSVQSGSPFEAEFQRIQPDGVDRWFKSLGWPLRNPSGKVIRWYGLLVDMNERHLREQELQRMQVGLARAMQVATAGELAASIVHEVSQPLAAILANAEASMYWLDEKTINLPNARRDVERIVRDANGAGDVMSRVRELFRRSAPVSRALNMAEIISEVLRLLQTELSKRQITVQTEWRDALPMVWGDRVQIQQVVLNLLNNAMDAMDGMTEENRKLVVRLEQQSSRELLTEVRDFGAGVKNEGSIFESFFTTKDHGLGMGLSICKSIIQAHRGSIWTQPCEGAGASFRFTLPMESEQWP